MLDVKLAELHVASAELFYHPCPVGTGAGIPAQGWCWTITAPCQAVSCSPSPEQGTKAARGLDGAKPPWRCELQEVPLVEKLQCCPAAPPAAESPQPDARGSSGGSFLITEGLLLRQQPGTGFALNSAMTPGRAFSSTPGRKGSGAG